MTVPILVDGPAVLPAAHLELSEPMWYALFFFLREVGTLASPLEEFVRFVSSADTPQAQLEMLQKFQPDQDRMSQTEWDTAIYHVLARAAQMKELVGGQTECVMMRSPVTLMQSADAHGKLFDRATKACCCTAMQHIKLEHPHAECMLTEEGLQDIARHVDSTVQAALRLT